MEIFPFAGFAIRHVLFHSRIAAISFSQHQFLESSDFETWIRLFRAIFGTTTPGPTFILCRDLFNLLISQSPAGCSEAVAHYDSTVCDHDNENERSISAASNSGCKEAEAVLQLGSHGSDADSIVPRLPPQLDRPFFLGLTPLGLAA